MQIFFEMLINVVSYSHCGNKMSLFTIQYENNGVEYWF